MDALRSHYFISSIYDKRMNQDLPFIGHLEINGDGKKNLTIVYYLNNNNVLCILKKKYPHPIFPRDFAVIYAGKESKKITLGGMIFKSGYIDHRGRIATLPSKENYDEDGDEDGDEEKKRNKKKTTKKVQIFKF